jgi:transcriptional regulator with XRE-family HTH domain
MERERYSAGQILRVLRHQRGLTLKQAAVSLHTSAPVLSRKERDSDAIERQDIRLAVRSYQLSAWEAYQLWTAAGFNPEPSAPAERSHDARDLAEALLPGIAFPAFIGDTLGYVRAWNQDIEAIWSTSQSLVERRRPHIVDDLFSPRLRARLGQRWDAYVAQSLKIFYHKTLRVAHEPAFRALLDELNDRHGAEFVRRWNAAQDRRNGHTALPQAGLGGAVVVHDSPFGVIEYLLTQCVFQVPQEYELLMYVPLGEANQERYQRFKATVGGPKLYYSF